MKLYHGTNLTAAKAIKRAGINPTLNIGRELDFGYGFYLSDRAYARQAAKHRAKNTKELPAVLAFEVDVARIKGEYDTLVFSRKDKEWYNTVWNCRNNPNEDQLRKDCVIGPLADGKANQLLQWYKKHPNSFRQAVIRFLYHLPVFHTQYVLKTPKICSIIALEQVEDLKGGIYETF